MQGNIASILLEIIDQPFDSETDNSFQCEQTVVITVYNKFGKVAKKLRYGLIEKETVYQWIVQERPINLNNCYIKDLSLTEFRKLNHLDEQAYVKLHEFTAVNAYFDSDNGTDFSFAQFDDQDIRFLKSRFSDGNVSFYRTRFGKGDFNFSNAVFTSCDVNFQFSEFKQGEVSFQEVIFDQSPVSFVNTRFGNGPVNFKEALFEKSDANFRFANFGEGNKSFDKVIFNGEKVDFRTAEFHSGRVDFKRVHFGDCEVLFEETEFGKGKVSFRSSRFGKGNVSFRQADFGNDKVMFDGVDFGTGNVSFAETCFGTLSFRGCQLNNYIDLRVSQGDKIDLSDTIVRDIVDLKPSFSPVNIKELNISGMRNLGQVLVDWQANNIYALIAFQRQTDNRQKAEQFRILKENFNGLGNYNDEDYAYVEFKRFEAKAETEEALEKNKWNGIWVYPFTKFKWLVFDKMGLYATSPSRVFTSMVTVYLLFSLLYQFHPGIDDADIICTGADNDLVSHIGLCFYFSAITFLTIGYGDCLPLGQVKWIAPVEGWVGLFLMAYFTVAFVRKILR